MHLHCNRIKTSFIHPIARLDLVVPVVSASHIIGCGCAILHDHAAT
jgi:hypothetical protein